MDSNPSIAALRGARERLLWLVTDLSPEQLAVPLLDIVNPLLWEMGHVAWFQEYWTLRRAGGRGSLLPDADRLYDSAAIAHDSRWGLHLPSRSETLSYMQRVLENACAHVSDHADEPESAYFARLVTFHEDMHAEALLYSRQTLGYPAPPSRTTARAMPRAAPISTLAGAGPLPGDVEVPGGIFDLGARPSASFVFDNEKWAHPVRIEPFSIARAPVTQAEYAEFVEAGGYERDEWWSADGREWRDGVRARQPLYWRRASNGRWSRLQFDRAVALEEHQPVVNVCWYEAQAYCAARGRRLPSEAEWELAAAGGIGLLDPHAKRAFPWGADEPTPEHAQLGFTEADVLAGTCDVAAHPLGDSPFGCRQMVGNVWEWTASTFGPYPGFVLDPYKEYSAPWFGTHRVLRGGSFATQPRLIRNTWRNFYLPSRRDVLAGFRTCAL